MHQSDILCEILVFSIVVKRGKGLDSDYRVCVCVCVCVVCEPECVSFFPFSLFYFFHSHQAMPHGCNLFISYVINVHTRTQW